MVDLPVTLLLEHLNLPMRDNKGYFYSHLFYEKYNLDSLAAGIIQLSSSPLGPGFFFVEKKDKTHLYRLL